MVLGLESYIDPLCFGSNMNLVCVALCISFPKYPRSSKSDFGAKSYSRSSDKHFATGRWRSPVSSDRMRPISKRALWNLSWSDQTLGESSPVQEKGEHGHVTGSEVHLRALEPLAPHSYIQTVEIHSARKVTRLYDWTHPVRPDSATGRVRSLQ